MIPSAASLFLAGRAGEHVGFEAEMQVSGAGITPAAGSAGIIRLKVPFVFDVGSVKAGIVPFSTNLGAADSFEVLNTGAVAVQGGAQIREPALPAGRLPATCVPHGLPA